MEEVKEVKQRAKKGANGDAPPRKVVRNGRVRWEGTATIGIDENGKQKRKSYSGASQKEALVKKKELLEKISAKVNLLETKNKTTARYIKEFLDNALNNVKDVTINNYNSYYNNHIKNSTVGNMLFEEVQKRHLEIFIKELIDKNLSAGTINNIFKPFKLAFNYAKEENHIAKNPVFGIRLPKAKQKDIVTFTVEEAERIKKETVKNQYHLAFRILFNGLRISELLGISWKDVSLEDGTIYINKQIYFPVGKEAILVDLKTDSSKRLIPISDEIVQLLTKHKEKQNIKKSQNKKNNKLDLVFTAKSGNAVRQCLFRSVFNTMLKKLGLDHHTVHNARHSFCSLALESNQMTIREIADLAGHSNISVTSRYLHASSERKRAGMLALNF